MVRLVDCPACQIGDHRNHQRVIRAAPKGVMGGVACPCKGERQETAEERKAAFLRRLGLPLRRARK